MVLKIQDYLGFDNTYANLLAKKETLLEPPYMVDVILRETPIAPELSFKSKPNSTNLICEYPRLTRNDKLKIELSKDYVDFYMKIRSNAFYTPYGMMLLLDNPTIVSNSFVLEDLSLVPEERKIEPIGTSFNSPSFYVTPRFATFFADFVVEKILLKSLMNITPSHPILRYLNTHSITPAVMKTLKPFKEVPIFDVQFSDILVFKNAMSCDVYKLTLSKNLAGKSLSGDKISFSIDSFTNLIKCDCKNKRAKSEENV